MTLLTRHVRTNDTNRDRFGVNVVTMRDLMNMPEQERLKGKHLTFDGPVYITIDLDCLDPAFGL